MKTGTNSNLSLRLLIVLVISMGASLAAYTQGDLLRFRVYELPTDLPFVDCVYEDNIGLLWFGTYGGLYQYDGYEFRHFTHDLDDKNSLGDNRIRALVEDENGNLIIGTQLGVHFLNRQSMSFTLFKETRVANVQTLVKGNNGTIWAITNVGIYSLQLQVDKQEYFVTKVWEIGSAFSGDISATDALYFTDGTKLYVGDDDGGISEILFFEKENVKGSWISCIFFDLHDQLWVNTNAGIHGYDIIKDSVILFTPFPFSDQMGYSGAVLELPDQHFLVNTFHGLLDFDAKKGSVRNVLLNNSQTLESSSTDPKFFRLCRTNSNQIIIAGGRNFWFSDLSRSMIHFIPTNKFERLSGPGVFPELYEIVEGKILISDSAGQQILDLDSGKFKNFEPKIISKRNFKPAWLTCFFRDGENTWVGTENGFFLFEGTHDRLVDYFDYIPIGSAPDNFIVRDLIRDHRNRIWMATWNRGLYRYNLDNNELVECHPFPPGLETDRKSFRSLYQDAHHRIWIGSRSGLFKYIEEKDSFILYRHDDNDPESMSENTAFSVMQDSLGYIWSGSYGGGLNRLDTATNRFIHFSTNDGLLNNNIFSAIADKRGYLWLLSYEGITRFNPYSFEIINLTHGNGLGSDFYDGFLYGQSPYTGNLFFLGKDGLDFFHPDSVKLSDFKPPIVFTGFELFNEPVQIDPEQSSDSDTFFLKQHISYTREIKLNYNHRVFTIDYAALDFSGPENIDYAYQLDGFDPQWQYVDKKRSATYTNLDPGNYEFRVKSTNSDGVWNENYTALALIISPPWWNTGVAYLLYFVLIVSTLYFFYWYQRRRWELQSALQIQEKEALRLKELDHLKTNLYTNITHEFRTPLTIIGGMTRLIREKPRDWLKKGLDTIEVQSHKLLEMVSQMLDLQKIEAGRLELHLVQADVISFLNYIVEPFLFQAQAKGLNFEVKHETTDLIMDFDPEKLATVVSNVVSNALKFTEQGKVSLATRITSDTQQFQILIADTGLGIDEDKLAHIFDRFYQADPGSTRTREGTGIGLSLVKELVTLMAGTIEVESNPAKGSRFSIELPVTRVAKPPG